MNNCNVHNSSRLIFYIFSWFLLATISFSSIGQPVPFATMDSINVNKLNAAVLVHGDMFWNPVDFRRKCKFPYSPKKNLMGPTGIWISGYDAVGNLHLSAQTYRYDGNDFWPGALPGVAPLPYAKSADWAKIWKLTSADIQYFQTIGLHTIANTHPTILSWPAAGNIYAAGNGGVSLQVPAGSRLAPFVDVNNNGIYEPLSGDYPDVPGDEALWYVFNDNGPSRSTTSGLPLGLEIQATSYAYGRGTLIDNVVYYRYKMTNKSAETYHNFRFSIFADVELGYYIDDYIGYDSTFRMGIVYNIDNNNTVGFPVDSGNEYEVSLPMAGITCIHMFGTDATGPVPMGAFTYFRQDMGDLGYPTNAIEFDHYMRGRYRSGANFRMDYKEPGVQATGTGDGPATNIVFDGDPVDATKWSECSAGNNFGGRNFVLTCPDIPFLAPGGEWEVTFALVASDPTTDQWCSAGGFNKIRIVADTAWRVYAHPPPSLPIDSAWHYDAGPVINVYPNPATGQLILVTNTAANEIEEVVLYDLTGTSLFTSKRYGGNRWVFDISNLAAGTYYLRHYSNGRVNRIPVTVLH